MTLLGLGRVVPGEVSADVADDGPQPAGMELRTEQDG
jgi:hypothetical protein